MSILSELPLKQVKVIELEGLAPTVFCGMILSDFGADVIMINRPEGPTLNFRNDKNFLNRGKRSVVMNLKLASHLAVLRKILENSDVLIDPYRPGVLEKMGLGPEECFKVNRRLIICRISGYGQTGPLVLKAGHDINYLANSGVLGHFGKKEGIPGFPNNILADFIGGGALGAFGILAALIDRVKSGKGQVVDNAMTEAGLYMGSYLLSMKRNGLWNNKRGENVYDSGAPFYQIYQCKDGKYLSVGAVDKIVYFKFIQALDLESEKERLCRDNQLNNSKWDEIRKIISDKISTKTSEEWDKIFNSLDVCVAPVLSMEELPEHPLHKGRKTTIPETNIDEDMTAEFKFQPTPSPKLSNHHDLGGKIRRIPGNGENTLEVLLEFRVEKQAIEEFYKGMKLEMPKL